MSHFQHSKFVEPQVKELRRLFDDLMRQLETKPGAELKRTSEYPHIASGLEDSEKYAEISSYQLNITIDYLTAALKQLRLLAK